MKICISLQIEGLRREEPEDPQEFLEGKVGDFDSVEDESREVSWYWHHGFLALIRTYVSDVHICTHMYMHVLMYVLQCVCVLYIEYM